MVDVVDGWLYLVKIFVKEMFCIVVDVGKICCIDFVDGELEVKKDDEVGDYYVLLLVQKFINVFVKMVSGQIYVLIFQLIDMLLEIIVLWELVKKENDFKWILMVIECVGLLELVVKCLVVLMVCGERLMEFDVMMVNKEIGLWNEVCFVFVEWYMGQVLVGEYFCLINILKLVMCLVEQELYK